MMQTFSFAQGSQLFIPTDSVSVVGCLQFLEEFRSFKKWTHVNLQKTGNADCLLSRQEGNTFGQKSEWQLSPDLLGESKKVGIMARSKNVFIN